MKLLFLKYNNYYNRQVKRENTVQDYVDAVPEYDDEPCKHAPTGEFNFNYNDGISTSLVYNWTNVWLPDYLVCYEGEWSDAIIQHVWFITKCEKVRKNQFKFNLKRDTVAENIKKIADSTAYIDKGYVSPDNKLFLNKDGITANQIKSKEDLIGDKELGIYLPWVVGYVANSWDAQEGAQGFSNVEIKVPGSTFTWDGWHNFPLRDYIQAPGTVNLVSANDINACFRLGTLAAQADDRYKGKYKEYKYNVNTGTLSSVSSVKDGSYDGDEEKCGNWYTYDSETWLDWGWLQIGQINAVSNSIPNFTAARVNRAGLRAEIVNSGFSGVNGITSFTPYSGRIKDGNRYYDCIVEIQNESKKSNLTLTALDYIDTGVSQPSTGKTVHFRRVRQSQEYAEASRYYKITIREVTDEIAGDHTFTCNMTNANPLNDAPYKMFCFPLPNFGQSVIIMTANGYSKALTRDEVLQLMSGVITGLGKNLYDIQILPYCPIRGGDVKQVAELIPESSGDIPYIPWASNIRATANVKTSWILDGENKIAPLMWATRSTFTFESAEELGISYDDPLKVKRWVNTRFARLVSPNQSNTFEFGLVQNGGINGFQVDCQYKPFSPHIHVKPKFGGIYGENWNKEYGSPYYLNVEDPRGLICSGDFSFPQTTSEWVNYQLDNKNYQLQFNREIDSLELQQEWKERGAGIGIATNTLGGAIKGGMAGAMTGNPYVAAGGAVVGAATGMIDSVYNYNEIKSLGRDAIELKRDLYSYDLQNIKARPNNLTNIGALSPEFRYFPYYEIYQESNDEIKPIENKLKYEGFNIGVVGRIGDYIGPSNVTNFIRASLTRIEDIGIDANIAQDIAEELARGVYVEINV